MIQHFIASSAGVIHLRSSFGKAGSNVSASLFSTDWTCCCTLWRGVGGPFTGLSSSCPFAGLCGCLHIYYIAAAFFLHLVPLLLYSWYIAAVSISVSSFCCCRYGAFAYFLVSRRYGYSSVADFRQRGRDETGSQEDDDAEASSNAEEPTPEEATPAAEPVPAPEAAEAAEEVAETEAEPQPPTPRNSTRPRRAASRRVLEQFENLQKEQQQQEGQTPEEDEEGLAEGGENIAALIKERDEEDLQLDQDIHSSEEESEAGAEDLMNEADMPLSEILK